MFSEADKRLAERAAKQHSVFTIADARAAGLTDRQIGHRRLHAWVKLFDGVYRVPGAPETWKSQVLAACLAAGYVPEDRVAGTPACLAAAISHRCGGHLYELPGGSIEVELTCRRWDRARRAEVVVHESSAFAPDDIQIVDGIPVFRPEVIVVQLASSRPYPPYIESVIQAARRKRLITYDSMYRVFVRFAKRGRRGSRAMRVAMELWNPNSRPTQSEMETLLMQALRANGLPEPVPQHDICERHGVWVACVDAGLPQWKVAVDYDSKQEHSDEFQLARDNTRRNKIVASGYTYLVARHVDLRNGGHQLCDDIRSAICRQTA